MDLPEPIGPKEINRILQEKFQDPAFRADAIGALEAAKARLQFLNSQPQAEPVEPANHDAAQERDMDRLLTAQEVSEILSIPKDSVYELGGLSRVQLGERRVRWRYSDVLEFIEKKSSKF